MVRSIQDKSREGQAEGGWEGLNAALSIYSSHSSLHRWSLKTHGNPQPPPPPPSSSSAPSSLSSSSSPPSSSSSEDTRPWDGPTNKHSFLFELDLAHTPLPSFQCQLRTLDLR